MRVTLAFMWKTTPICRRWSSHGASHWVTVGPFRTRSFSPSGLVKSMIIWRALFAIVQALPRRASMATMKREELM